MNYKKELLKENGKALQFLHRAHGFDFESDIFIGCIFDRFTFKTVNDQIRANVDGDYTAALLIKPAPGYAFQRLHYVTTKNGKFCIDHDRRAVPFWRCDIDYFFTVGDFENTRKNETKCVYIIAQKTELLKKPKPERKPETGTRYNVGDVRKCGDGRGNHWIDKIELLPRDGSREKIDFSPYRTFYGNEKRSDIVTDHIDKSGYILRFRRLDLYGRAKALKAERERAAALAYDWSERENETAAGIAAVKKHLANLIDGAETYDDGKKIDAAASKFRWLLFDFDSVKKRTFSSVEQKTKCFDSIAEKISEILTGGADQ